MLLADRAFSIRIIPNDHNLYRELTYTFEKRNEQRRPRPGDVLEKPGPAHEITRLTCVSAAEPDRQQYTRSWTCVSLSVTLLA